MSRPLRVEFEGAVYHITARGNNRKEIFRDDQDRLRFLETLGEACTRFGLVAFGYCLMPNHYHLLAKTPRGNLSQAVGWVQATWAARFNRRHGRSGHLVQGRFKAHLVDADAYARQLVRYVHLNPVRPRDRRKPVPTDRREHFESYRWSSHRAFAGTASVGESPQWLSLEWLSYWQESAGWGAGLARVRRAYRSDLASCFGERAANPWADLRGGLVLGGEQLWEKTQALLGVSPRRPELEWSRRNTREQAQRRAAALSDGEPDKRVRLWLRVTLGGERMTDLAREFGYRDGSGVLQVVKRLEARAITEKATARQLRELRAAFDKPVSSVRR